MRGIYIHIPFCLRKCPYCDFYSITSIEEWEEKYINALCENIRNNPLWHSVGGTEMTGSPDVVGGEWFRKEETEACEISSVYMGGGTPSLLSEKSFDKIFQALNKSFFIDNNIEKTVEVNPATCDRKKLGHLRKFFNRISIGCQSFNDLELKTLGRLHNSKEAIKTIKTAYEAGFENISIDLMYNIPYQTAKTFENSLKIAKEMPIKHLSAYELTFEENTPFWENRKELIKKTDNNSDFDKCLRELADFKRYEVSNYAKKGYESKHNLNYWHNGEYYGFGAGAVGYIKSNRYKYVSDINEYCKNKSLELNEKLSPKELAFENLMLGLRMVKGFEIKTVTGLLNDKDTEIFLEKINSLKELVILEDGILKATSKGMDILNTLIIDLYTWE